MPRLLAGSPHPDCAPQAVKVTIESRHSLMFASRRNGHVELPGSLCASSAAFSLAGSFEPQVVAKGSSVVTVLYLTLSFRSLTRPGTR